MIADAPAQRNWFVLTLDVDSDANRAAPGRIESVSASGGPGETLWRAALPCTRDCLALCAGLSIPSTWFLEARTAEALAAGGIDWRDAARQPWFETACHSLAHEDFSGRDTGIALGETECARILSLARERIEALSGVRPLGFRAPYNRVTPALESAVARCGFLYHSSVNRTASDDDEVLRPRRRRLPGGAVLTELDIPRLRDPHGRLMSSYLWPYFEGKRRWEEYPGLVERFMGLPGPGPRLIQLALHPWQFGVTADGRYRPAAETERMFGEVRRLLETVRAMPGLRWTTVLDFVRSAGG